MRLLPCNANLPLLPDITMIFVRVFALLALLGVGGSLIAWMLTGDPKYRRWAWAVLQVGVAILLILFLIFAIERVL